jgi:hypothetical protein
MIKGNAVFGAYLRAVSKVTGVRWSRLLFLFSFPPARALDRQTRIEPISLKASSWSTLRGHRNAAWID